MLFLTGASTLWLGVNKKKISRKYLINISYGAAWPLWIVLASGCPKSWTQTEALLIWRYEKLTSAVIIWKYRHCSHLPLMLSLLTVKNCDRCFRVVETGIFNLNVLLIYLWESVGLFSNRIAQHRCSPPNQPINWKIPRKFLTKGFSSTILTSPSEMTARSIT
jgi:hypothetical protein